ncbi:hypothetical protein DL767_004710 [Monosporascus sp. MG133]|nr:hypothetical protein DL767_004710 [Monosporascus sp. MG133]
MFSTLTKLIALGSVARVWSHAVMKEPVPRQAGPVHEELCGAAVAKVLARDRTGPIENAMAAADGEYNCDAYFCRGYQYEDNVDNVKAVKAGDVLDFKIDMVASHRPGYANVSIVDIATNEIIEPLRTWDEYPGYNTGPDRDDIKFNVTIPDTLGVACDAPGKCVLQWYWYVPNSSQTYESCLDLYVEA